MGKAKKHIWRPAKSAAANAQDVLPLRAEEFFRAGRKAVKSADRPEALHKFRPKVKKFRYTLELFRSCYGPGLEKRLKELKKLQDFLGALSDLDTASGLLDLPAFRKLPERATLIDYLQREAAVNTSEFVRYWNEEFNADGQERKWVDYLRRTSLRPAKAAAASNQPGTQAAHSA